PIDDVIEPHLKHAQEVFASHSRLVLGGDEMFVELALEHAIDVARLLLLLELQAELALLAAPAITRRRAGRRRAPLDGTRGREAALALQEQLHALTAAQSTDGSRIASH